MASRSVERILPEHCQVELPMQAVTAAAREASAKQRAFIAHLRAELDAVKALSLRG